jgi:hypothetical protein
LAGGFGASATFNSEVPVLPGLAGGFGPSGTFDLGGPVQAGLAGGFGASATFNSEGPVLPGLAGDTLRLERTYHDGTTLTGTIELEEQTSGAPNAVQWALKESKTQQDGVPSFLRTAILLKRKCNEQFSATTQIVINDGSTSIQTLLEEPRRTTR